MIHMIKINMNRMKHILALSPPLPTMILIDSYMIDENSGKTIAQTVERLNSFRGTS